MLENMQPQLNMREAMPRPMAGHLKVNFAGGVSVTLLDRAADRSARPFDPAGGRRTRAPGA